MNLYGIGLWTMIVQPRGVIDEHDRGNRCDCCGVPLDRSRLLAGGSQDPRRFCSFECFDRWKRENEPEGLLS